MEELLSSEQVLRFPDFSQKFIVRAKQLNSAGTRYSAIERELIVGSGLGGRTFSALLIWKEVSN